MRKGAVAWIGVAGGVIAADYWLLYNNFDTMSIVFGDALADPRRGWFVLAAWGLLTAHLFADQLNLPEEWARYDPIGFLARKVPRKIMDEAVTFTTGIQTTET